LSWYVFRTTAIGRIMISYDRLFQVANEVVAELKLKPEDVYLGQGKLCSKSEP
jgi:hypothetical protein